MVLKLCLKAPLSRSREESQGHLRAQIMRKTHGNEASQRSSPEFNMQLSCSEDNQGQVQANDWWTGPEWPGQGEKNHSPGQEQQAPVTGTENSTSTAQMGTGGPGLSLNGFLGPWGAGRVGWRSQVRLPRPIRACPQALTVIKVSPIKILISLSRKEKK